MIDNLKSVVEYIGTGNTWTIIVFLIGLFAASYFYFRTFFRLVYSASKICLTCKELGDWNKNQNSFRTRVLFYNNGRKTITKDENKQLEIISLEKGIKSAKVLENQNTKLIVSKGKIKIQLKHLDSKEFFIIEIDHFGHLDVEGRISETGEILHTEPKGWLIINIIFAVFSFTTLFYNFHELTNSDTTLNIIAIGLNLILLLSLLLLLRFIHSLFFIPYRISNKYLNSKNKVQNEFTYEE